MSVSAVVVGCTDRGQVLSAIDNLREQTVPPDEIIAITCCMESVGADKSLRVEHRDEWGQEKCDYGLRLADCDRVFFHSSDDLYTSDFIEKMSKEDADIVLCGFESHAGGTVACPEPKIGQTTRGAFMLDTEVARGFGYIGRDYSYDGEFIENMVKHGSSVICVNEILHFHN